MDCASQRYAEGHFDRLPDLARELVPFDLAAIATASTPPAPAAKASFEDFVGGERQLRGNLETQRTTQSFDPSNL